ASRAGTRCLRLRASVLRGREDRSRVLLPDQRDRQSARHDGDARAPDVQRRARRARRAAAVPGARRRLRAVPDRPPRARPSRACRDPRAHAQLAEGPAATAVFRQPRLRSAGAALSHRSRRCRPRLHRHRCALRHGRRRRGGDDRRDPAIDGTRTACAVLRDGAATAGRRRTDVTAPIGASLRARVPYEPIHRRAPLALPGRARVALWTIVNVENCGPQAAQPRRLLPPPMGQPLLPDVPNWAWHEYGMRVGFWRFLETLGARGLRATFAVNGSACEVYREACEAARDAGWEFMGHGFVQQPMHRVDDQRKAIADTIESIRALVGKPPRGWESPGLTETDETVDLLAEAGIEYVADWVLDEQPVRVHTRAGELYSVPYTVEIN